ncbi:MAG: LacI family DNA-binding transcriptional regulator [Bryobacteraceae bacterium]
MKKRAPTIQDVAREAGVSPSTVSNVLNRRWKQTSRETRERILQIARDLNYQPNTLAASLRRRSTRTVGVVLTSVLNPFNTAVLRGIQDAARAAGYTIIVGNTDYDADSEREILAALRARQVDGMLVVTNGGNNELLTEIHESGLPVVLIDRGDPSLALDTVRVDNEGAAEQAVGHLLDLGHRRVAFVGGLTSGVPSRAGRLVGYRRALSSRSLPLREEYEVIVPTAIDNGRLAVTGLLNRPAPPTALFVANTFLAIGVLQGLRERGLRMPGDMSFVMFDDPDWATATTPALTTVSQPTAEIGNRSFDLLEHRMKHKRGRDAQTVILPTSLRIRESSGYLRVS